MTATVNTTVDAQSVTAQTQQTHTRLHSARFCVCAVTLYALAVLFLCLYYAQPSFALHVPSSS